MPKLNEARSRILESAQNLAQTVGYCGFSYRDIANEIGIKSASIHYHFPKKDDLIIELSHQYRTNFFEQLAKLTSDSPGPEERIKTLVAMFEAVLIEENRLCLCGMMAADVELLSEEARESIMQFYSASIDWLSDQWAQTGCSNPKEKAVDTFVSLEGAMLISRMATSPEPFEIIKKKIEADLASGD